MDSMTPGDDNRSLAAAVFPGQGSQRRGMALDFFEAFGPSREAFQRASEALSLDVVAICRDEDERLGLTEYTQPCILTAEIAMLAALRAEFGFAPGLFGGHSLGEYTALVAAGAMPFEVALGLVRERGRLMQTAVPAGLGGMTAVIGDAAQLQEARKRAEALHLDVANDNSPNQVVMSGELALLRDFEAGLSDLVAQSLRVVPLSVSAPFHSRWMRPAQEAFAQALESCKGTFEPSKSRSVTSNYRGSFYDGTLEGMVEGLSQQISGQVRWRDNMAALLGRSELLVEIGPGKPLSGFFQASGRQISSIISVGHARRIFAPSA